jgi:hypothetical protein
MTDRDSAVTPPAARLLRLVPDLDDAAATAAGRAAAPSRERRRPRLPLGRRGTSSADDHTRRFEHGLAALGPAWRVVRGIGGTDAVLVGPPGVFALTVAVHPNACVAVHGDVVAVSGQRLSVVPSSRAVAGRLSHELARHTGGVTVRGVVAILQAAPQWALHEQPDDGRVVVLAGETVVAYLVRQPTTLSTARVQALAATLAAVSDERLTAVSSARLSRTGIRAL